MNYRTLGKTNLSVSEIGFGGEWLERHPEEHSVELIQTIREHYLSLAHTASECQHCGACESRCPFEVKVSGRMQKAAELFE